MLDMIEHQCPDTLALCYADDTALVIKGFWKEAPTLMKVFQEFAQISGLHLNFRKCIIMPLDEGGLDDFRTRLQQQLPAWKDMQVSRCGKYLGFYVGPDKGDRSWEEPTEKFLKRCELWGAQGTGLFYQTTAYNTFALSTLTYISQLESPPASTLQAEIKGLRKVIKGPGQWCQPADLWRLHEHYGQAKSCKSLSHTTAAAQLRVWRCDPACRTNNYRLFTRDLQRSLCQGSNDVNRLRWIPWYERSFALRLEATKQDYTSNIGNIEDLVNVRARSASSGCTGSHSKPKSQFQRKAYNQLLKADTYNATQRTRHKLQRYELQNAIKNPLPANTTCRQNTPAWCARRALANLQLLPKLVPSRVCAAAFSTQWNRWCTHRRFQRRNQPSNRCLLGCGPHGEDSIEHYFACPITRDALRRKLNLPDGLFANLHTAALCNANIRDTDCLATVALLNYALYTTTNQLRSQPTLAADIARDMLVQNLREGAKRHTHATAVLDNRWNRQRHGTPLPPIPYTI